MRLPLGVRAVTYLFVGYLDRPLTLQTARNVRVFVFQGPAQCPADGLVHALFARYPQLLHLTSMRSNLERS